MSRKHLAAALAIALAALSEPAAAELRGTPEEPPVFTAAEVAVISRNAVLAALIQDNPWVVRRVLDAWPPSARRQTTRARRLSGARRLRMSRSIPSPILISINFGAFPPKPCSTSLDY